MKYLACFLLAVCLSAQVAKKANEGYVTPEGRARVGSSLTAADRHEKLKPKELVDAMGLKPGMTIADVGTGAGFMLPYLSEAVGPGGRVIAQDIFEDFLQAARKQAAARQLKNVEFVLGSDKDPRIPKAAADAVLVLDAYHHFDYPEAMLANIASGLKPGGKLFIVEYHKNQTAMANGQAMEHIRLGQPDAIVEIEKNGFRLVSKREHVPSVQWMATFEKK